MRTLYVTDLDGTFLNQHNEVPKNVLSSLSSMIDKGLLFTIATGRSYTSVLPVIPELRMSMPAILLNGVQMFDMEKRKIVYTKYIGHKETMQILKLLKREGASPFVYTFREDGHINMYYDEITSDTARAYLNDRYLFFHRTASYEVIRRKDLVQVCSANCVPFIFAIGSRKESLMEINKEIGKVPLVHSHFYQEDRLNLYSLEIMPSDAGKNGGINFLKKQYDIDRVVSFGDNFNDIDMKQASDLFCVPDNAYDEVKKYADIIIESNHRNGVFQYIKKDLEKYPLENTLSLR